MSWVYLFLAISFEVFGTSMLKISHDMISLKTAAMLLSYGLSLLLLSMALKKIDIGIAYAIWSGMGILAIVIIGVFFFREHLSVSKIIFIALIMIGTIGLNFSRAN
ncbi:MAG TPA: multidrug efflux SMR transporter [Clostridia bacterium]|nr:multidrug efflux SMR transporter [Clostridia bacterium]